MIYKPRPSQEKILSYLGGKMGISAVPGSGKTWTLSRLAADIISGGKIDPGQEVLVVTLVNSAVENFSSRIASFISQLGLLPQIGYRVRTLHGLAHDIVREKPSLVGLDERFQIIDDREANLIRNDATFTWLKTHPAFMEDFISSDITDKKKEWIQSNDLPITLGNITNSFIRTAKDLCFEPEELIKELHHLPDNLPLAQMGSEIYLDYQRALAYRGAVDFDDLIRFALSLLEMDHDYLERLQNRWPYILEDEAQDSSQLQERVLRLLCGKGGNWVRVGDPNQAIFETFTTANPRYLRNFISTEADYNFDLPESGRSQPSIIELANQLVRWTMNEHPVDTLRDALSAPPFITPSPPDDPQPNPENDPESIHFAEGKLTPADEVKMVIDSIESWLPDHQEETVAVLVPRNDRGSDVADQLKLRGIAYVEYLKNTTSTRTTAGAVGNIIAYLADPLNSRKLARCYEVWRRGWREKTDENHELYKSVSSILKKCADLETYTSPRPGNNWIDKLEEYKQFLDLSEGSKEQAINEIKEFKILVTRWQGTTLLPIDQIVLTIAQDIFTEATELALIYKLALMLRQTANAHNEWGLPELSNELAVIARNERNFMGFSSDEHGFDPGIHKGKVVITTMHKAKGLEWDRVYLISINNYDFPSAQPFDAYIAEKWYIRSKLDLEAEALAQLHDVTSKKENGLYLEGQASMAARLDYSKERLRLLYVGITRAKKELFLSWNTGRNGGMKAAIPLVALQAWWEANHG
ncbi:MAG TPA: ATP-dependent helicase [Anaerolineales bacterium]|nr:ATP-dependent helicase [Anaerolineales bacterium]